MGGRNLQQGVLPEYVIRAPCIIRNFFKSGTYINIKSLYSSVTVHNFSIGEDFDNYRYP